MAVDELPEVQELFALLEQCLPRAVEFESTIVRSVGTRYANEDDFLSGVGASKSGGRWNPPGLNAVYGSLDVITATHECYQNFKDYGFGGQSIRPRVIAGANVRLHQVLNLTNPKVRRIIGFTLAELLDEDWDAIQEQGQESWTQAIGRGCSQLGFEGILVPSARHRPHGINLVYYPDRLQKGSSAEPVGKNDLPPPPSSWPK